MMQRYEKLCKMKLTNNRNLLMNHTFLSSIAWIYKILTLFL